MRGGTADRRTTARTAVAPEAVALAGGAVIQAPLLLLPDRLDGLLLAEPLGRGAGPDLDRAKRSPPRGGVIGNGSETIRRRPIPRERDR
jgi:hypothetical protein